MSTILFFIALGVLVIVVMSKLPGLEHFVKPIISMLFSLLQAIVTNMWAWGIFIFKTLLYSHIDLVKHLIFDEHALDPSLKMKNQADGV